TVPVENTEPRPFLGDDTGEKRGAVGPGTSDFEVGRAGTADGAAAEERPADVGRTAARARDHPPGWMLERCEPGAEDPGLVQDLQRVLVAGDVKLVTRPSLERAAAVRPDLGGHPEPTKQAEGAASDGRVG